MTLKQLPFAMLPREPSPKGYSWRAFLLLICPVTLALSVPGYADETPSPDATCQEILSGVPTLYDLPGKRIYFLPSQAFFTCSESELRAAPLPEGTVDGIKFQEMVNTPGYPAPDTGRVRTLPIGCLDSWGPSGPPDSDAMPLRDALELSSMAVWVVVEDKTVGYRARRGPATLYRVSVLDVLRKPDADISPGDDFRFLLRDGKLELPSGVVLCETLGKGWYVPSVGDELLLVVSYPPLKADKVAELRLLFHVEDGLVQPNGFRYILHENPVPLWELR